MNKSSGELVAAPTVIGVDIGGVLVDRRYHDEDTSFFGSRPLDTPPVRGCFVGLRRLVELANGNVHIVSKAGPRVADLSMQWLRHHEVLRYLPESQIWFVDRREHKAFYAEELGITHFIDDRIDVLAVLTGVSHRILFTGTALEAAPERVPRWAHRCATWDQLTRYVETTLRRDRT